MQIQLFAQTSYILFALDLLIVKPIYYSYYLTQKSQSFPHFNSYIKTIYLSLQLNYVQVFEATTTPIHFYYIDHEDSRLDGLLFVSAFVNKMNPLKDRLIVLAGGGDGTVNWLLSLLIGININFNRIIFGAFPLGTGNDFAKNLGWPQFDILGKNRSSQLQRFVRMVKLASVDDFDVWQAEVQTFQQKGGSIVKEKWFGKEIRLVHQEGVQKHMICKNFTNYFSFGMDAKVGFEFNRYRSKSQFANYCLYFLIGCFNRFKKSQNLSAIVEKMEKYDADVDNQNNISEFSQGQSDTETPNRQGQITRNSSTVFSKDKTKTRSLREPYKNIVAQNINYYMGGVKDIWANAKKCGIQGTDSSFRPNSHDDGVLEFISFKDEWSMGYQRVFKGRGRRIAQGVGPFKFQFSQMCEHTYINFDGEYYKVNRPKEIRIQRSRHFKDNKLRVLRNASAV